MTTIVLMGCVVVGSILLGIDLVTEFRSKRAR
jgi:hypothetical protein